MKVLVAGASGFVGANLCRALDRAGHTAIAGVRGSSDPWRLKQIAPNASLRVGSLDQPGPWLTDVDAVINASAYGAKRHERSWQTLTQTNIHGAMQLLQSAKDAGVSRYLQLGTAYEHGHRDAPIRGTDPLHPLGMYGASKAAASHLLFELGKSIDLQPCVVRLFNLFGETMGANNVVAEILNAARTGQTLETTEGVEHRDFTDVEDVSRWLVDIISLPAFPAGQAFTMSGGRGRSMQELFHTLVTLTDAPLAIGARPSRGNFPQRVVADITPLKALLGDSYTPPTPLADSIARLMASS